VALIPIMSTSLSCAPNLRFSRGLTGLLWVRWVSPVLRCAQKTLLTTATAQEAAENKIDLPEDNPAIIDILIRFLYEGEYEPKSPRTIMGHIPLIVPVDERYHQQFPHTCERLGVCEHPRYRVCPHHQCSEYFCGGDCRGFVCKECTGFESHDDPSDLLLHVKLYEVADKYDITGLKMLAREKFRRSCVIYWDHDSFPAALEYALSSTPDEDQGLKEIISETILAHASLLEEGAIEEIISEHKGFMYQVLKRHSAEVNRLKK
jgi:hypothetical protein